MAFSEGTNFERKVDSYLRSSSKLSALEASRLELHWKKLCEQEKRSKERNRELLRDFDRVEQQAAVLDAKTQRLKAAKRVEHQAAVLDARTQRLKAAKKKYEDYINLMYPRWKEELQHYRSQAQNDRDKFSETSIYPSRSVEFEQSTYPHQSNRSTAEPYTSSFGPRKNVRGQLFPASQLDQNNNRSYIGDQRNRPSGENPYWNKTSLVHQDVVRDLRDQSERVERKFRIDPRNGRTFVGGGSYYENYQEPLHEGKVPEERRATPNPFCFLDEVDHRWHGYSDNQMSPHRLHPQSVHPYPNNECPRQQPQYVGNIQECRGPHHPDDRLGEHSGGAQLPYSAQNQMENYPYSVRQENNRLRSVPYEPRTELHEEHSYADRGLDYRGDRGFQHGHVTGGVERHMCADGSYKELPHRAQRNGDQRDELYKEQSEVYREHKELSYDSTNHGQRTNPLTDRTTPLTNTVIDSGQNRPSINMNSSGVLHRGSTQIPGHSDKAMDHGDGVRSHRDDKFSHRNDIILDNAVTAHRDDFSGPKDSVTYLKNSVTSHRDDMTSHRDDVTVHQDNGTGHRDGVTGHGDDVTGHRDSEQGCRIDAAGSSSVATSHKDDMADDIGNVNESKRMNPQGSEMDDTHPDEDYVFPSSQDSPVKIQDTEVPVKTSDDERITAKQQRTLQNVNLLGRDNTRDGKPPSSDFSSDWTEPQSGDGDLEEVSELSLRDGTGEQETRKPEMTAKHQATDVDIIQEGRNSSEKTSKALIGSSKLADKEANKVNERESGSNEVISDVVSELLDKGDGKISEDAVQDRADTKPLVQNVENQDVVPEVSGRRMPSVNVEGFLHLLRLVDGDVEVSFSPETIYRSPACSPDMKEEIVKCALSGASLETFDPSTVSMIVLDELPLLVRIDPSATIISEAAIKSSNKFANEKQLRSHITPSFRKVWKALFYHFVNLVVNNVMTVNEVGALFGPLVVKENSQYLSQVQTLLTRLIKDVVETGADLDRRDSTPSMSADIAAVVMQHSDPDVLDKLSVSSGDTSSTLSGTPPIKSVSEDVEEPGARPESAEPAYSYEDDFDEDDVPLTQTAAYQKLMSSTRVDVADDVSDILSQSAQSRQSEQNESEADDDLERELVRSISPPPLTSPRQRSPRSKSPEKKKSKQRPKLSLFNDGRSLGASYGSEELGESWGSEHGKTLSSSRRTESVSSLSPPLSPDAGAGYIPSAVEKEEDLSTRLNPVLTNSTLRSEPKSISETAVKRKPGFWNHSDTESEVDLQLSTGGQPVDDDTDDFDFYG